MLALTLKHPWSWAIAHAEKRIENRTLRGILTRLDRNGGVTPFTEAMVRRALSLGDAVATAGGRPLKAVVKADIGGVSLDDVNLEISGRELVISGERSPAETEGRVYQQVEIDSGPFRRVIELQADVDAERAKATYEAALQIGRS